MKIIDLESRKEYIFDAKKEKGQEASTCPKCSHTRKKKTYTSFSWNHEKKVGYCNHCNSTFVKPKVEISKAYSKPALCDEDLGKEYLTWFNSRGIIKTTLEEWYITQAEEWLPQKNKKALTIQFNYFRDDELINVKARALPKDFTFSKNAELTMYGLHMLEFKGPLIIVEGEMDAITVWQCGLHDVLSVPNGAKLKHNNLDYMDGCIDIIDSYDEYIIATDNDLPGVGLRRDLSSRLGVEKCYKVNFKECSDPNEYFLKYGEAALLEVFEEKIPFPIEGAYTSKDLRNEVMNLHKFGLQKGLLLNDDELDALVSWEFGRLYTFTGIPGHGKSELVDYILTKLSLLHKIKAAIFSPENHPIELHISKFISKISGSYFDRVSYEDLELCLDHTDKQFHFISPPEDLTIDSILTTARQLVKQKGVRVLVIDPYNRLEHNYDGKTSETNYISKFLDKLTNFAKLNNIMIFLVAHPRKMSKDQTTGLYEVPTLYDINGSANFFNKTDFGITTYRDFNNRTVEIYIQKVKFKHLGEVGKAMKIYNTVNGRYEPIKHTSQGQWNYDNWLKEDQEEGLLEKVKDYSINDMIKQGKSVREIKSHFNLSASEVESLKVAVTMTRGFTDQD